MRVSVLETIIFLEYQVCTPARFASLRSKLDICVKGEAVPDPIMCFSSCGLPEKLVQNLETAGYIMPTPVQMQVIPASISNRSLLVSADTGSGKTVSFLVPIIAHCSCVQSQQCTSKRGPWAIILAPTRELCLQVEEQAKVLGKGLPFKTALVVGGDPLAQQIYRIENVIKLIVGTPGRLIDLLMKHNVDFNDVSVFVLDEVDCFLDRGFRDQAMQIFQALSHLQALMFSARVHSGVEKMSNSLANNVIHISCGNPSRPNKSVKQVVIWVESKEMCLVDGCCAISGVVCARQTKFHHSVGTRSLAAQISQFAILVVGSGFTSPKQQINWSYLFVSLRELIMIGCRKSQVFVLAS